MYELVYSFKPGETDFRNDMDRYCDSDVVVDQVWWKFIVSTVLQQFKYQH